MEFTPLSLTDRGLYCEAGDFFVDPWRPVPRAVVTHAHADHACWGCGRYLTSDEGERVLRVRMGAQSVIDTLPYSREIDIGSTRVSLHPAGHILGSSQVRIEHRGQVCVISGDYKAEPDATCRAFEPVRCHTFITESTFGLPIYRWPTQDRVFRSINDWWLANREAGKASLLFGYALGKAQRMLAGLDPTIGPIFCHGAVEKLNRAYREQGIALPPTRYVGDDPPKSWAGAMIVAPPSAQGTPWIRKFGAASDAFASGWMTIRGTRRRRAVDRGFVLSDHVDWPSLLASIDATEAEHVYVTHGYSAVVVRWLREQGRDAHIVSTRFEGERDDLALDEADENPPEPVESPAQPELPFEAANPEGDAP